MSFRCDCCKHQAEEGYINSRCLRCKYAYFEWSEAFENKSDLYEKKDKN